MARKKSRRSQASPAMKTAMVAQSAVTGVSSLPVGSTFKSTDLPPRELNKQIERSWIELVIIRIAHMLGSLQVAVVLLALFAVVLAIGTMVESWYASKIAGELVYRTWWFTLLLGALAVNIFFAAAKK